MRVGPLLLSSATGAVPMRPNLLFPALLGALLPAASACAADATAQSVPSHEEARAYLRSLFVASPYRLNAIALAGEIQYRLQFAVPQAWSWPQTDEQRVVVAEDGIRIAICDACGDEPQPSPDMLRRYLAANAWVRSDDPRIQRFARQYARGLSVRTRMQTLTAAVRNHMNGPIDYRRYDDAVTALENRNGDCTEFAVLLAAAARARKIPVRLVHGLAYSGRLVGSTHVFSPHAWVQAWDGERWVSYDAAYGKFDAGHIVLAIGDGDPAALRGLNRTVRQLRIADAAGVRRTPIADAD
jgi:transglutaminase-like putative cysteine protease